MKYDDYAKLYDGGYDDFQLNITINNNCFGRFYQLITEQMFGIISNTRGEPYSG